MTRRSALSAPKAQSLMLKRMHSAPPALSLIDILEGKTR